MDDAYNYLNIPVILYISTDYFLKILFRQKTCFCNRHSNECSPAQGYSVYNIISTFDQGESVFLWVKLYAWQANKPEE